VIKFCIDFKFNVVRRGRVDRERLFEMRAEKFAGCARRFDRHIDVMNHAAT
jgi:hypothetical protein